MRKALLSAAIGLSAVICGPSWAADVNAPKVYTPDEITAPAPAAPSVDWNGVYVAAGVAIEAHTLGIEGVHGIELGTENAAIVGRLGYRFQRGAIVAGVFGEIAASNLEYVDGVDANLTYATGADLGLAFGGVLLAVEGGFQWTPVDLPSGLSDIELAGPFAGVKISADLGAQWEITAGLRKYFLEDDVGGATVQDDSVSGTVMLGRRFRF